MGGQDRVQMIALEEEEGVVVESIGMVVHIVTIEQERGVASLLYILVPSLLEARVVSFDFKHIVYLVFLVIDIF